MCDYVYDYVYDYVCNNFQVLVGAVPPRGEVDVSVEMQSPPTAGMFQGQWRMSNPVGNFFGGLNIPIAFPNGLNH